MISLEEALRKIDQAVEPLPARRVPLLEAVGCCLAEEIVSKLDVPSFASSAMDGIAISYSDLDGDYPVELTLQGTIPAGEPSSEALKPGHAFRIMTGAPLPDGADTVIMVEELEFTGEKVRISKAPTKGDHIRIKGDDLKAGTLVFPNGYPMGAIEVALCARMGLTEILVHTRPSIAVLATGSEIQPAGRELKPGQIYNSNSVALRSLIATFGLPDPGESPSATDDPEKLTVALQGLCNEHDVVITSGAVSAGKFDYIPAVVERLGGELLFHKVFVKPGKPTLIARVGKCWLLGLPGNPVAVVVAFHLYGKRLLSRLMGHRHTLVREKARLEEAFEVVGDRFQVVGAFLRRAGGDLKVKAVERYSSGQLSSIRGIDGFIFIPGGTRQVEAGTVVEVEWL